MAVMDSPGRMSGVAALFALCLAAFFILPCAATSNAFNVPDTGQSKCYDSSSAEISCSGTGQDGAYSFNPMSYSDNGNGTVTDNVTGLMWQKQDDGTQRTWADAGPYCDALTLGGYSDWRLPSKKELISIVDYSVPYPGPTSNPSYFTGANEYWSEAHDISFAWYVSFYSGGVSLYGKPHDAHVRCVRGGQYPSQSFTDNGDGTVSDNVTSLMWQQQDDGTKRTWSAALTYCEGLSLADYSDWRLPDIKELESVTKDTENSAAIDAAYFPETKSINYWSSTVKAGYTVNAWVVPFGSGTVQDDAGSNQAYARCVRGGQPAPTVNTFVLTVSKSGTGSGTVTADSGTIIWSGNSGTASYNSGTSVVLTAVAESGSTVGNWTGCDSVSGSTCMVAMSSARSVTATFDQSPTPAVQYTVTVNKSGTGSGSVIADSGIISWADTTGTATYDDNTSVILTATASKGSTFGSWSGCDSTDGSQCTLTMNAAKTVTATFSIIPNQYSLSVTMTGEGSGTVTSSPSGIRCGDTCSKSFKKNIKVTLRVKPAADSIFTGWSGTCSGSKTTCTLKVDSAKEANANFDLIPTYILTVTKGGDGSGTVAGLPRGLSKGINCGDKCSDTFLLKDVNKPVKVTLKAKAASGSQFTGWSGACSGAGSCKVEMDGDKSVTATFKMKGGGGGSTTTTIEGKVSAINGAKVRFYALNVDGTKGDLLGSTSTDTNGNYTVTLSVPSTPILVEASGGSYVNEATGIHETLLETDLLTAVLPAKTTMAAVTPLTHMAAARARKLAAGSMSLSTAVGAAIAGVAQQYNLVDILEVFPVAANDADHIKIANLEQRNYGIVLAGIAQEASILNVRPVDLSNALATDMEDGMLDGFGPVSKQTIDVPAISGSVITLPPAAGTQELQTAIDTFLASNNNMTNLAGKSISTTPVNINPAGGAFYITATALPAWTEGQSGMAALTANGGQKPYTCSVTNGSSLPSWLTLSPDGVLSGTAPVLAGGSTMSISPPFSVTCKDATGLAQAIKWTVTIVKAAPTTISVSGECQAGTADAAVLVATAEGGVPPYYFTSASFAEGAPPMGMAVGLDGKIEGACPDKTGTYNFQVCAVDSIGTFSCNNVSLTVKDAVPQSPYKGSISGNWSGACKFLGDVKGTFSMNIDSSGGMTGSCSGTFTGTIGGSVDTKGNFISGGNGGAAWTGTFSISGNSLSANGSWTGWSWAGCSGVWSGSGAVTQ